MTITNNHPNITDKSESATTAKTKLHKATAAQLAAHTAWQETRHTKITGPTGPLSLVETRWFMPGTTEAQAAELVQNEAAQSPATVTVTPMRRARLNGDGEEFGLRRWQADAPAISAFLGMAVFDYDPQWQLEATFTPATDGRTVAFEHIQEVGATRELTVPGDVTLTHNGQTLTLTGFRSAATELIIPFSDQTTGSAAANGSYAPGRFLLVDIAGADQHSQTPLKVVLDFNYAFVPPCGFSAQFNCPMPPAQNRLPWEITAGEQRPQYVDGFDVHKL